MHSVESRTNALQALFSTIYPASTPRGSASAARTRSEDLHRALVQLLLRRTAKQRGAASLILGDSSTRMAIRLIETVSKGAGHKLPIEGAGAIWVEGKRAWRESGASETAV